MKFLTRFVNHQTKFNIPTFRSGLNVLFFMILSLPSKHSRNLQYLCSRKN